MVIIINKDPYISLCQMHAIHRMIAAKCIILLYARQQGKTHLGTHALSGYVMDDISKPIGQYIAAMNTMEQCNKFIVNRFRSQLGALEDTGLFSIKSVAGGGVGKEMVLHRPWISPESKSITHLTGMGNKNAIRGGSYDFGYFDEVEQYPEHSITNIIMPMFSETRGRILLSGTTERFGQFYKLAMSYDEFQKEGDRTFLFIDHDVFTCNNFKNKIISRYHKIYQADDNMQGFWAEYMNNPFMAASKKNPFTTYLNELKRVQDKGHLQYNQININLDRGISPGHMPYIAWQYNIRNEPVILDYSRKDFRDLFMIPDLLVNRYKNFHRINIIFPSDIYTSVFKEGHTEYSFFMSMLEKKGLTNKICVTTLPKIVPNGKKAIIKEVLERFFKVFSFLVKEPGVGDFVKDTAQIEFTQKEKTGYYDYGTPVANDFIHVLDTAIYTYLSRNLASSRMARTSRDILNKRKIKRFDGRLF